MMESRTAQGAIAESSRLKKKPPEIPERAGHVHQAAMGSSGLMYLEIDGFMRVYESLRRQETARGYFAPRDAIICVQIVTM